MKLRSLFIATFVGLVAAANAQGWSEAYDKALQLIGEQDWKAAQEAFQESVALRPEDQSNPTNLPGPVTEPRRWRDGSAYSPNFGAAYCTYKLAASSTGNEQAQLYKAAIDQFETLLAKEQHSRETYYFLRSLYSKTGDSQSIRALNARATTLGDGMKWRIDGQIVEPGERASINAMFQSAGTTNTTQETTSSGGPDTTVIKATDLNTGEATATSIGIGDVAVIPTKYALIIGNSESMMEDQKLGFAASDALVVHNSLIENAGYAKENIDMVVNATAEQMVASAMALAERMPQDGTVLVYFTGAGFNIAGKDYFAGIDADSSQDSAHMVAVSDIYQLFLAKGASIFFFTQAHRTNNAGLYFGKETPMFGRISQAHATIPGAKVHSLVTNGKPVGAYTLAFTEILSDFRSNQIPVTEFVWQVFYKMRRGGGPQTPTLPVLIVLSADARF